MKTHLLCIAMLVLLSLPAVAQEQTAEPLTTVQLVMLKKGSNNALAARPEGKQILKQHTEHLYALGRKGSALIAGPFIDGGEIQGVLIIDTSIAKHAQELAARDPAVEAGILVVETQPLVLQKSSFGRWGKWTGEHQFEQVYFGFLLLGDKSSQDADAVATLQAQHLAYMAEQHAQGKLLTAGPLPAGGHRRGFVVYRTATMQEALERAAGDPMVKAGRLAVELHPWQIPVGSLPGAKK
jgi:uncharacterized protein